MNLVTGALLGSVANYTLTPMFDKTLTPLYHKGSELLGLNLSTDPSVNINPGEFTSLSTDPYVGYFSSTLSREMEELNKKRLDDDKIEENTIVSDVISKNDRILDNIATLSVAAFILYTTYKVIKVSRKFDLAWDLPEIFID